MERVLRNNYLPLFLPITVISVSSTTTALSRKNAGITRPAMSESLCKHCTDCRDVPLARDSTRHCGIERNFSRRMRTQHDETKERFLASWQREKVHASTRRDSIARPRFVFVLSRDRDPLCSPFSIYLVYLQSVHKRT